MSLTLLYRESFRRRHRGLVGDGGTAGTGCINSIRTLPTCPGLRSHSPFPFPLNEYASMMMLAVLRRRKIVKIFVELLPT